MDTAKVRIPSRTDRILFKIQCKFAFSRAG
ncbi:hypothetical protein NC652_006455 [Populus alba x Populus x berolinensis]|uniref:Uncharacterized protein n=1 Tax=Populus alba x Populus x berolinensis TaxID=444605 RepID=A0AAD6RFK0_9ROSI|nr:hypothetical protein NC652_006455 [Populus alba x Populus x berolinensis]KAJ7007302.1 hypothetical protein NC653_006369 [Populus alba x Populus x berolinensis]